MAEKIENELTLEEIFSQLDQTLESLNDEDLGLEESFKAYEKGMALVKQANEKIDKVEKQVLVLNEKGELNGFDEQSE